MNTHMHMQHLGSKNHIDKLHKMKIFAISHQEEEKLKM